MAWPVGTCGRGPSGSGGRTGGGWSVAIGLAPQCVHEDPDAAAGSAHVLDLARRDPVVDGPTADADQLTRLHDAYSLTFHVSCLLARIPGHVAVPTGPFGPSPGGAL